MFSVDLHCHSTVSDGTLSPDAVATRAHANGTELLALTDHDEIEGVALAAQTAHALGMNFLSGVEISVTYLGKTVHIVGLGMDTQNPQLLSGLAQTRSGRTQRAMEMGRKLEQLGFNGAYAGALVLAGNADMLSRTHFARWMVNEGICSAMQQAFHHYLGDGKAAYAPHHWALLEDAVTWIRGAGGAAVIAHPGRYGFDSTQEWALFTDFVQAGGQAVEVATGSHAAHEIELYTKMAQHFGLAHSCGSDFHDPDESRYDLGQHPMSPALAALPAVWELLEHRIQFANQAASSY